MALRPSVALPIVVVLISGCLGLPSLTAAPAQDLPDRPETLTSETVANYTTAYEAATIFNRVREHNPTENRVSCRANTRVATETAFVQRVQCTGGLPLANGEHIDIAANTHYYVDDTTTARVGARQTRTERHQKYRPDGSVQTSFTVVNFAGENVSVTVELARNDAEAPTQFDYTIQPNRSVVQTGIPVPDDTSRVLHVSVDDAEAAGDLPAEPVQFAPPTVIYVLPDGSVRITHGPSMIRDTTNEAA